VVERFNGAAAFQPRIPVASSVGSVCLHTLQWGRGISAADT